jgi:hypothetical protein
MSAAGTLAAAMFEQLEPLEDEFDRLEADLLDDVVKCGFGVMQQQCAPPQGNEHVIIEWGIGAPP